jgi:hypothetical protein
MKALVASVGEDVTSSANYANRDVTLYSHFRHHGLAPGDASATRKSFFCSFIRQGNPTLAETKSMQLGISVVGRISFQLRARPAAAFRPLSFKGKRSRLGSRTIVHGRGCLQTLWLQDIA